MQQGECGRVGVGGHGRELGAQVVSSAPEEGERADPRQATAHSITTAFFVLYYYYLSVDVRVHGVYAVSVIGIVIVIVRVLILDTAEYTFQIPILGRGARVRRRLRGQNKEQG